MKNPKMNQRDPRIKQKIFPLSIFIGAFLIFAIFTTLQMKIIGDYINIEDMPAIYKVAIVLMWIIGAFLFTLITRQQINIRYEKPIQLFAEASKKVAEGDFSVYVPPRHTEDKTDELDVIFLDFNKMVEELGSIETLKIDFFSNVSHEFKTPIAAIQNYAELIKHDSSDQEKTQNYAQSIVQSSKRLSNLITNMLKLNKLEKQNISCTKQSYDLSAQLCQSILQFESLWEEKNIEVTADVPDCSFIIADEGLFELVWTNLLSNAFKFTQNSGTISLCEKIEDNNIIVSVSDNGCGMSDETLSNIFDKFYQGDTSHSMEGNGLGLSLVKRILELEDCEISVTSIVGTGTTFQVVIPTIQNEELLNESNEK